MTNNDIYTLKLNRLDLCDLMLACTSIVWQSIDEMKNDPECPEYRREHVLPETIKKWQALHDQIETQLDAQDRIPYIDQYTGEWMVWDEGKDYPVSTGIKAKKAE